MNPNDPRNFMVFAFAMAIVLIVVVFAVTLANVISNLL
jgi:hypothetical protein